MTRAWFTPKAPDTQDLEYFRTLEIDCEAGLICSFYNSEGIGSVDGYGYVRIASPHRRGGPFGPTRKYKRANIIWWKATGEWPKMALDHINRDSKDDRLVNLREATIKENNGNRDHKNDGRLSDFT